jgi:hypothetical protein
MLPFGWPLASEHGPTELLFEMLDPNDHPMKAYRVPVDSPGPLKAVEGSVTWGTLVFSRPGCIGSG